MGGLAVPRSGKGTPMQPDSMVLQFRGTHNPNWTSVRSCGRFLAYKIGDAQGRAGVLARKAQYQEQWGEWQLRLVPMDSRTGEVLDPPTVNVAVPIEQVRWLISLLEQDQTAADHDLASWDLLGTTDQADEQQLDYTKAEALHVNVVLAALRFALDAHTD